MEIQIVYNEVEDALAGCTAYKKALSEKGHNYEYSINIGKYQTTVLIIVL
jgi:hypothetical protein